jgi:hypothetical protein
MNRVRHSAFHVWPYRFNPATILVEITTMQTVISTIVFVLLLLAGSASFFIPSQPGTSLIPSSRPMAPATLIWSDWSAMATGSLGGDGSGWIGLFPNAGPTRLP